jgi:hypothetical protein
MLSSKDFKDVVKIEMVKDSLYTWKICFNLTNYEISKELRQDFEEREKKYNSAPEIVYEVTFADSYPHDPVFIRVLTPRFRY